MEILAYERKKWERCIWEEVKEGMSVLEAEAWVHVEVVGKP